jgi:hypothetical protein
MNDIKDFISNILLGNNAEAKENFNDLVSSRAMDTLSERKQQIAQSLFQTEEKIEEDVEAIEEGPIGAALGGIGGTMLGGPVGGAIGAALGHKAGNVAAAGARKTGQAVGNVARGTGRVLKKVGGVGTGALIGGALGGPVGAAIGGYAGHRMTRKEEVEHIDEKAVSQQQQKFMGMVYAAKKGMKPASPEVAKVAAGMTKKQAKDFAETKHKGLPEKK